MAPTSIDDEAQWFVERGPLVQGPLSTNDVRKFFLIGRVRKTDSVSRDGEIWEPITQVPELIPEELLGFDVMDYLESLE